MCMMYVIVVFFFFKQKTAYEMRISDWSSDVCSSDLAERLGTPARLIQRASDIDPAWLAQVQTLGLTAGASAPEQLVREVVNRLGEWRSIAEQIVTTTEEHMIFKLPRQLTE